MLIEKPQEIIKSLYLFSDEILITTVECHITNKSNAEFKRRHTPLGKSGCGHKYGQQG